MGIELSGCRPPGGRDLVMSARGSASQNGNHHRVAAKVVFKIERGRPATSVHGYVLAVFRARARARTRTQHRGTRTRTRRDLV
jgi:hypothetical protein